MISAIRWVPRGANKELPLKYELTEAEFERIKNAAGEKIISAKSDLKEYLEYNLFH